jgi:hypothetical protein
MRVGSTIIHVIRVVFYSIVLLALCFSGWTIFDGSKPKSGECFLASA